VTALFSAASNEQHDLVELLLLKGADASAVDKVSKQKATRANKKVLAHLPPAGGRHR
jgi:hypothetical protein